MIRLQNGKVIYNNSENLGAVEDMNFTEGGFIVALSESSSQFIPEEDSTQSEQEVFQAYHEYYKDTGGIKPRAELSLEQIKLAKLVDLNTACNIAILSGFEYVQNGNTYLLGFDEQDQANLTQIMAILSVVAEPIVWKVKGELVFIQFTRDEFLQLGVIMKEHKEGKMQRYYQLCGQVAMCTTKEEVDAIVW